MNSSIVKRDAAADVKSLVKRQKVEETDEGNNEFFHEMIVIQLIWDEIGF